MKITGNKILITGGGSGIGLGMTERLVKENNTLIICGRRESVLKEVTRKYPSVIIRSCDLSVATEREDLYKWISEKHNDLNILINNAGIQNRMPVSDKDFFQHAKEEISINIDAPLHLISLFLNLKSLTTIINTTSGLSFVPISSMPVYCASKAFFHSFTLSLRHSLKSRNIEVIELIPPALNTDLGGKGLHITSPPVNDFIEAVFMQLKQGKTEISFGFSETISKSGPEDLQRAFERMNI